MLKEIRFQNFRCFKDLKIEGLQRFNIFGGKNNVGKTAVLEGVYIGLQFPPDDAIMKTALDRGMYNRGINLDIWNNLIKKENETSSFKIHLKFDNGKENKLLMSIKDKADYSKTKITKHNYSEDTNISEIENRVIYEYDENGTGIKQSAMIYGINNLLMREYDQNNALRIIRTSNMLKSSVDTDFFSNVLMRGEREKLICTLQEFEPKITDLLVVSEENKPFLSCKINEEFIPIQLVGEGTARYLNLLLTVFNIENGFVLIDEIENGIHYSILERVLDSLYSFAEKRNVQIFATTHSRELVEAAHRVFSKKDGYPFRYYRLDEVNGDIVAKGYDKDVLDAALEGEWEIR